MADANPVIKAINDFFGDTTRSASQTSAGLADAIAHAQLLLEALPDPDNDFEDCP